MRCRETNIELRRMAGGYNAIGERGDCAATRRARLRNVQRRISSIAEKERSLCITTVRHRAEIRGAGIDREDWAVLNRCVLNWSGVRIRKSDAYR